MTGLSKPPERRQGLGPRSVWLLVGTPLVLGPELASRGAEHSHSGGCLYIFLICSFYHLTCLCHYFYGLSAFVGYWSSAFIRRIIYTFLNVCSFDYWAFAVSGKVGIPVNRFNPISLVTIFIPTGRPKSVRDRCVIEFFGCVVVFSRSFLGFSVGVWAFVIGQSQISSFFTYCIIPFWLQLVLTRFWHLFSTFVITF